MKRDRERPSVGQIFVEKEDEWELSSSMRLDDDGEFETEVHIAQGWTPPSEDEDMPGYLDGRND